MDDHASYSGTHTHACTPSTKRATFPTVTSVGTRTEQSKKSRPTTVNQLIAISSFPHHPGFVDGHIHFPQTRIVGSASGPLLPLPKPLYFLRKPDLRKQATQNKSPTSLKEPDSQWHHHPRLRLSSSICKRRTTSKSSAAGLRMTASPVLMDSHCPDESDTPELNGRAREFADAWNGYDNDRLAVAVIPRFALSCSAQE